MLTPVDQPLDKLEDLTLEEMSVLSFLFKLLKMLTPALFGFSKREHEGLDPAFHDQVYCLWAASRERRWRVVSEALM